MHVRLGGVSVAVTVHRQAVHHADVEYVIAHIGIHALGRVGHGLQEGILFSPDAAAFLGAAGVDPDLSHGGAEADGDVLDGPAEARHGVALEVGQHQKGIVVGKVTAHIIYIDADTVFDRDLHAAFLVQNVQLRYLQQAVVPGLLAVHGGGGAAATVGGVALHDGAVHPVDQISDQLRAQVVAALALAGGHFDAHLAGQLNAPRLIGRDQAFRGNVADEVHHRRGFIRRAVREVGGVQGDAAVRGQAVRQGGGAEHTECQQNGKQSFHGLPPH